MGRVSSSHQVDKVLELQLWHQSFQYSELISFRTDWFDLLAVQGILKSLHQHQSSKTSILQRSAFFMIQLSHLHITTEKTVALTLQIFVKAMSPLFNTLPTFVMAFLPRSKCLLISWLWLVSTVFLEPKFQDDICHHFHFSPTICHMCWDQMT